MKLRALRDRVIVKKHPPTNETNGGIIIPDLVQERPVTGEVIDVGPGLYNKIPEVKIGDIVVFGKYEGTNVKIRGEEFLVIREPDLLAVINNDTI